MTHAIETENLTRMFGTLAAVDGVNLSIEEGEVFGVLGPNGAGKTTMVRLLNGILTPSKGKAFLFGKDVFVEGAPLRKYTGVLTETPSHYERLTARQNLSFYATMFGVSSSNIPSRIEKMLALFGLESRQDDLVGQYSKGMKQRLALARALIHDPKVLFLDEPTAGLDPEAAMQVDNLVTELVKTGNRTIFLCTHNLHEAQSLCDRVAMLNKGKFLAIGSIHDLTERIWHTIAIEIDFLTPPPESVFNNLMGLEGVTLTSKESEHITLTIRQKSQIATIIALIVANGGEIVRVSPREYSLEEIYFAIQKGGEVKE